MFYLWALHERGVECHMRCSNKTNNEAVTSFASSPSLPSSPRCLILSDNCQANEQLKQMQGDVFTGDCRDLKDLRTSQTH